MLERTSHTHPHPNCLPVRVENFSVKANVWINISKRYKLIRLGKS